MQWVMDNGQWKQASQSSAEGRASYEYTLPDQTPKQWTELVTVNTMQGYQGEDVLGRFLVFVKKGLESQCAEVQWKTIKGGEESVLYEWTAKGCASWPDQYELARVIQGDKGLYILHYASKEFPIDDPKRAHWMRNFSEAKIS